MTEITILSQCKNTRYISKNVYKKELFGNSIVTDSNSDVSL